jgi:hypothetical protein
METAKMETAVEYLVRVHERILKYGYEREHAGVVSLEVARLLLAQGERPHIETVYEERHVGSLTTIVQMTPLSLKGEVPPWFAHNVCCTATEAYDPLLGKPVPKDEYTQLLFGQQISMKIDTPEDRVAETIDRILG